MSITITLTGSATKGVDFNAGFDSYFADLVPTGWPYILGGSSMFQGNQIVLLDQDVSTQKGDTRAIVMDAASANYYFNDHTLSGRLTTIRLSTLGQSYDSATGGFAQDASGHIINVTTPIEISGLNIYNAYRERGDFHETVYGLMGGGQTGGLANAAPLKSAIWAQAHRVEGSTGMIAIPAAALPIPFLAMAAMIRWRAMRAMTGSLAGRAMTA